MTHTNSNTILGVVAAIGTSAGIFSTPANADLLQYSTTLFVENYTNQQNPIRTWQMPKINPQQYVIVSMEYLLETVGTEQITINNTTSNQLHVTFGHRITPSVDGNANLFSPAFNFALGFAQSPSLGANSFDFGAEGFHREFAVFGDPRVNAFYGDSGFTTFDFRYSHNNSTSPNYSFISQQSSNVSSVLTLTFDVIPVPAPSAVSLIALSGIAALRRRR